TPRFGLRKPEVVAKDCKHALIIGEKLLDEALASPEDLDELLGAPSLLSVSSPTPDREGILKENKDREADVLGTRLDAVPVHAFQSTRHPATLHRGLPPRLRPRSLLRPSYFRAQGAAVKSDGSASSAAIVSGAQPLCEHSMLGARGSPQNTHGRCHRH